MASAEFRRRPHSPHRVWHYGFVVWQFCVTAYDALAYAIGMSKRSQHYFFDSLTERMYMAVVNPSPDHQPSSDEISMTRRSLLSGATALGLSAVQSR